MDSSPFPNISQSIDRPHCCETLTTHPSGILAFSPGLADGLRRNAEKCRQLGVTMQPRTGEEAVQNGIGIGFGWYCVHEPAYTRFLIVLSISAYFLQEV